MSKSHISGISTKVVAYPCKGGPRYSSIIYPSIQPIIHPIIHTCIYINHPPACTEHPTYLTRTATPRPLISHKSARLVSTYCTIEFPPSPFSPPDHNSAFPTTGYSRPTIPCLHPAKASRSSPESRVQSPGSRVQIQPASNFDMCARAQNKAKPKAKESKAQSKAKQSEGQSESQSRSSNLHLYCMRCMRIQRTDQQLELELDLSQP